MIQFIRKIETAESTRESNQPEIKFIRFQDVSSKLKTRKRHETAPMKTESLQVRHEKYGMKSELLIEA
jgi:hypothetical protein